MPIVSLPLTYQIVNGTTGDATQVMGDLNQIANNVNANSIARDGTNPPTTNFPLGGFRAVNAADPTAGTDLATKQYVDGRLPAGALLDFAGTVAPSGYLLCDGSAISRTTYAALFTAIGTTWGAGDGSTTFNVPDIRGRTTIGAGQGAGLTNRTAGTQNIGEEAHALTVAELAAHNHTVSVSDPGHTHSVSDLGHTHNLLSGGTTVRYLTPGVVGGANYAAASAASTADATTTQTATTGISLAAATTGISASATNTGSGTAHNNMQPSAVVTKIIKT